MAVKGRMTVRKSQSALADGATIPLWTSEPAPGTTLEKLQNSYLSSLDAVDKLEAHREEAAKSGQFTEAGLVESAKKFALSQLAPALHRSRQEIQAARKEALVLRNGLTLQPPDKTDVVGAMRRQEIRAWLRSLPEQERRSFIASRISSLDPEISLAIVEAPPELSGVLTADRQQLVNSALQAQHGDSIEQVVELERAIGIAEQTVEAARTEIARDVALDFALVQSACRPVRENSLGALFEKISGGRQRGHSCSENERRQRRHLDKGH